MRISLDSERVCRNVQERIEIQSIFQHVSNRTHRNVMERMERNGNALRNSPGSDGCGGVLVCAGGRGLGEPRNPKVKCLPGTHRNVIGTYRNVMEHGKSHRMDDTKASYLAL